MFPFNSCLKRKNSLTFIGKNLSKIGTNKINQSRKGKEKMMIQSQAILFNIK